MKALTKEIRQELENHIMPFWKGLIDREYGGFYGLVTNSLEIDKKAGKGAIATARQLWSFSSVYRVLKKEEYLTYARHAFQFLIDNVYDHEHEGLYWMVDYKGNPLDTRKHVYVQAFGIYALSEYYRVTGEEKALDYAKKLFHLIETVGFDREPGAYKEEFTREWVEQANEMLSENGVLADITYNTHLHILEAYTNLYRVWKDDVVRERLTYIVDVFYDRIYDSDTKFMKVFFNKKWESLIDLKSYGHDIEASWLIDDALKVLGLVEEKYINMVVDMAYNIADQAILEDGSLAIECENGIVDRTRIWWAQAEAMVGFLNAFERTKDERFLAIINKLWEFIKTYVVDRREGGEWHWSVLENNEPGPEEVAGPWKAPYHNSRFCLEFIERLEG